MIRICRMIRRMIRGMMIIGERSVELVGEKRGYWNGTREMQLSWTECEDEFRTGCTGNGRWIRQATRGEDGREGPGQAVVDVV